MKGITVLELYNTLGKIVNQKPYYKVQVTNDFDIHSPKKLKNLIKIDKKGRIAYLIKQ